MPVFRRPEAGHARRTDAGAPRLERALTLTLPAHTADLPAPGTTALDTARAHWEEIAGRALPGWLPNDPVGYHEMAHAVGRALGPAELSGVDLIVLAMGVPDWRHETMPGAVLAGMTHSDPLVLGVAEQGPTAPFTALRIAASRLATGRCRRALVVLMEQPTLPPCPVGGERPGTASAVALLLATGPGPGPRLGPVRISVAGRPCDAPTTAPYPSTDRPDLAAAGRARTVLAGPGLAGRGPAPGVRLVPADPRLPATGVWAALARRLAAGPGTDTELLVADRDPALPYRCAVPLTWTPTAPDPDTPATGRPAPHKELVP
ncbi:hypothetical protein [Streptomyces tauricus]|uniref:hypothetical protein n=1 Tax=Streptomyces TaxID=1883 RepID=UPI0033BD12F8